MDHQKAEASAAGLKWAIGGTFAWLTGVHPVYVSFLVLMVFDFITGVLAAAKTGNVDSSRSRQGIQRKAVQVILVLATELLYRSAQTTLNSDMGLALPNFPAGAVVAGFYCAHEFISILENAGRLGVFIPRPLRAALKKLNEFDEGGRDA